MLNHITIDESIFYFKKQINFLKPIIMRDKMITYRILFLSLFNSLFYL
jgi:hypothetical protein